MNLAFRGGLPLAAAFCLLAPLTAAAQDPKAKLPGPVGATSYMPVTSEKTFDDVFAAMSARKAEVMRRQRALLEQRYDLADRPATGVTMSRGKPVQGGVRVKLHGGVTWQTLAKLTPAEMRSQKLFPEGFKPLPHPIHEEGGMVFPETHIQRDPGAGEARPEPLRRGRSTSRSTSSRSSRRPSSSRRVPISATSRAASSSRPRTSSSCSTASSTRSSSTGCGCS